MSTTTKAKPKSKKKKTKLASAFHGIVIGVFEDIGPIARYRKTSLSLDILNLMVVHGMSAVHGGEEMLGGLFGPLPVFENANLRYMIYSFNVKASNTKDSRIAEHGRVCSVFLILKEKQERYVLNNHLTIEKILQEMQEKKWKKELDITKESMLDIFERINEIVKIKTIRVFSFGDAGLIEYEDPQMVLDEGIISIIDMKKEKIYMYLPQEKFDSRQRIKSVEKMEELNLREYGSRYELVKYRDYVKFKKILNKYSIQLVK
ncbi:MAG: hypothetical protein KGD59_05200 [Candidatus Heimdallarchaeota archaeon]|nr:hypothetical protein [Candidatus Heimdallarchaeota archaeon]MBY8993926.1 hypothetical protein [Candidatus Heimdallarchaeota archaeon]